MTSQLLFLTFILNEPSVVFGTCENGCHGQMTLVLFGRFSGMPVMAGPPVERENKK